MNHCMAACHYLKQSRRGLAGTFGNRFVSRIDSFPHRLHLSPADPVAPSSSLLAPFRRVVHASVYDKNLEELDTPAVVPDEVIQPQSEEYWAPHPKTGVFGPAVACGEHGFHSSTINTTQDSVLEQKAFFRPLEDLEKPPPQP